MTDANSAICYKKNYITEAVAHIQFATSAAHLKGPLLHPNFQNVVKRRYKIFEPSIATEQTVQITLAGVRSEKAEIHDWTFHGASREKTIKLSERQMHVSNRSYVSFDEFKSDFVEPLEELARIDPEVAVARTGLRYINVFENLASDIGGLTQYFAPMVSSGLANLVEPAGCVRQVQISEYLTDDFKIRIQTGIFNPDYPAVIKRPDFVLDIDCYVDTPHRISEVSGIVDQLHAAIQDKFEQLVTDDLRKVLRD
jgi:uncharacterized protein (TIGR04255 family)